MAIPRPRRVAETFASDGSPTALQTVISWEDAVCTLIEDRDRHALVEACYFDLPLTRAANATRTARSGRHAPQGVAVDVGARNGIVSHGLAEDGGASSPWSQTRPTSWAPAPYTTSRWRRTSP